MNRVLIIFGLTSVVSFASFGIDQDKRIDSLKNEIKTSVGSNRFEILFDLFRSYLPIDNDSALKYADSSLEAALLIGDSLAIARSYNARGWVKYKLGYIARSIPDYEQGLKISESQRFNNQTKYFLNNLAVAHYEIANYDQALAYNFKSIQFRESEGNALDISIALNNIGNVYSSLRDYENALLYYKKSRDIKLQNQVKHDLERCYLNIAFTYIYREEYDQSLETLKQAFKMCESGNCNNEILMELHFARGKSLLKLTKLDEAESEFKESQKLALETESKKYQARIDHSMAQISMERNNLALALRYLNESQDILQETEIREQVMDNYLMFVSIYKLTGDFQLASEYQQKYIELNNEIFSSDLIKNISNIQTAHEERENIKTIAATRQVLALQQEVIQRQRAQYIFIITITVLVMGLAFVLFWSNRSQRKANQALAVAKETIQKQNEMLGDHNKELESEVADRTKDLINSNEALIKVNAELDNFIYKTSHDIRGPLASLKGICNVALLDVKDEIATDYLKKLDTTASKMNSILSRLLIINQINHSVLNVDTINLKNLVDGILEEEAKKEFPPRLTVQTKIDPKVNLKSDNELVKIILENLIDNAIKFHTDSERVDPFVRITIAAKNEFVEVSVVDNGIGIHESNKDKIFELFVRASERSESGGIGLYLSKLSTLKLGGEIKFEKTSEGYTEFRVHFPSDLQPILDKRKEEQKRLEAEKEKRLAAEKEKQKETKTS